MLCVTPWNCPLYSFEGEGDTELREGRELHGEINVFIIAYRKSQTPDTLSTLGTQITSYHSNTPTPKALLPYPLSS